jgi:hypothetical protein
MDEGEIEVDAIMPITFADITPELARASGFMGVVDLLKVAQHGRGENVYLVRFHYCPARKSAPRALTARSSSPASSGGSRATRRTRARPGSSRR